MQISASAAHRVGIELHELPEAPRTRLLVAKHPAEAIATIGQREILEILRDVSGERRGQVVAQRQPLLVVVLEREHALVRPVQVGQELAERVGVFDLRRLDRIEAVALIDGADRLDHAPRRRDFGRPAVGEPARQACLQLVGFFGHMFGQISGICGGGSSHPLFCHYPRKRIIQRTALSASSHR